MVQIMKANKGQFFIISAVVIITFTMFIYMSMSQYLTPSSTFFTTNDVFTMENIVHEYSYLILSGLGGSIDDFTDYLTPNLGKMAYELNESHNFSLMSGNLVSQVEYQGAVGKSARDVTSNATVYNNENELMIVDIYWNVCRTDSKANVFTKTECGINIDPVSSYVSDVFLNNVPGSWDLLMFMAKINESNYFKICAFLPQDEILNINRSDTVDLYLNLSSEESILSSTLFKIKTISCNITCDQEDSTSCEG